MLPSWLRACGNPHRSRPSRFVVGEEEFLVDRAVRDLITAAPGRRPAGDIHDLDAAALGPGELESLTSPSLFGGGCVLVVRAAQNAGKDVAAELARYAARPAPDVALVLTHAGGAKGKELLASVRAAGAQVIECPKVTRFAERLDFVRAEFRRAGQRADDGAARALLDAVGSDLRELAAACEPARRRPQAWRADRRARRGHVLPGPGRSHRVHRRRPRGRGSPRPALEQLRWALATGSSPVLICSALAQGVRLLGRVGTAPPRRQQRALGRRGGRPAVEDRPGPAAAARLDPEGIARALHAVAEADAQVKARPAAPPTRWTRGSPDRRRPAER